MTRRLWAALAAAVLLVGGYAAAAAATADRVPAGVEVAGVDVGGLGADEARAELAAGLREQAAVPVPVVVGGRRERIDPAVAGLGLDVDASVDRLVGGSLDPRQMWRQVAGSDDVDPVTRVDADRLDAAVAALAEHTHADAVDGAVAFDGARPVVTEPRAGLQLDAGATVDELADRWFDPPAPIELPVDEPAPAVDAAAVERALASFAEPATAGPLVVRVGDRSVALPVEQVTPALAMTAGDGELVPTVDGERLLAAVRAEDTSVLKDPVDADVVLRDGRPTVVPGSNGTTLDPAELATKARVALVATGTGRTVTVKPVVVEPDLTTAQAKDLGVREVISEFATPLTDDADRTENLDIAARTVRGTLLLPGETFSLNDTLGERTRAKGYNAAGFISHGRLRDTVGGGVSQMATTLFNGMFFAGLEDVYHQPHSFYISRYPEGREATISWGTIDLQFRNDSGHGVLVDTWVADGQVNTRFWGTTEWEIRADKGPRRTIVAPETVVDDSPECKPQTANVGFDVTVTRSFVRDGKVHRTQELDTHYKPSTGVTCG